MYLADAVKKMSIINILFIYNLLHMNIINYKDINSNTGTEKYIQKHYPEFHQYLLNNFPDDLLWNERLYWYYNNIQDYPVCGTCGKRVKILSLHRGYKKFCCAKCSNSNSEKLKKTRETNMKLYGGPAPYSSKEIRNKGEQKCILKYGFFNPMKNEDIKNKVIKTNIERNGGCGNASESSKKKYIETCMSRYHVDNPMKNDDVKQSLQYTFLKTYNVPHPSKLESVKNKIKNSRRKYEINRQEHLIGYTEDNQWICKCPHPECNKCSEKSYIISPLQFESRVNFNTEPCTKLLPIGKDGSKNTTLEIFITRLLDMYNIEYVSNIRGIMDNKKELDIYIPNKNIAIECNGVRWHSSYKKYYNYHIDKYNSCQEKNIRLISIWEDWIINKSEIVKSMIINKLGLTDEKIYARKCILKNIDSKTCNKFLDKNHIQGRSAASIHYGLYYNDELVSVMTFGKPRANMGAKKCVQSWELVRFCSKLNTQVIGGADKIFKHFIKEYDPESIVSFSMNDISDGNLYKVLGFKSDNTITGSYWYIEPKTYKRYHRTSFTKANIVKMGWRDKVDNTWTESQVMEEHGYYKIHDSGQLKWVWNKNK